MLFSIIFSYLYLSLAENGFGFNLRLIFILILWGHNLTFIEKLIICIQKAIFKSKQAVAVRGGR
ncbi:hypothetical protein AM461_10220 [Providencia rettgeri]|nr:hypothetical protein AM461_10220 [Providencia rettgeri]